jgi:hypothetical protein
MAWRVRGGGRGGRKRWRRERKHIFPFQLLFIIMIFLAFKSASNEVSCLVNMHRTGSTILREGEERERLKERERERERERKREEEGGGGASSCCHPHRTNSSDSILAF